MENHVKVRFKLPNGEEFEAEGTPEFIETQRAYFLKLVGKLPTGQDGTINPYSTVAANPVHYIPQTQRLWETLFKEDGDTLVLRRKAKLPIAQAALLLVAGAQVLLKKPAYSALELARSLKACHIHLEGRLDRLLATELQTGHLVAQGAKRSRTYQTSPEGFTKAFVLAEKLVQEP